MEGLAAGQAAWPDAILEFDGLVGVEIAVGAGVAARFVAVAGAVPVQGEIALGAILDGFEFYPTGVGPIAGARLAAPTIGRVEKL